MFNFTHTFILIYQININMKPILESRNHCATCERFRAVIRRAIAVVVPINRTAKNPVEEAIPTKSSKNQP